VKRAILLYYTSLAAVTVVVGLRLIGVLGPAAFWFAMWVIATGHTVVCLRMLVRADARVEAIQALAASVMVHGVRCAGCHTAAILATGDAVPTDDDGNVTLPPGWVAFHERPYCPACAAKAN
jgi:hypothetical protein